MSRTGAEKASGTNIAIGRAAIAAEKSQELPFTGYAAINSDGFSRRPYGLVVAARSMFQLLTVDVVALNALLGAPSIMSLRQTLRLGRLSWYSM
jgi:hypothetical protein